MYLQVQCQRHNRVVVENVKWNNAFLKYIEIVLSRTWRKVQMFRQTPTNYNLQSSWIKVYKLQEQSRLCLIHDAFEELGATAGRAFGSTMQLIVIEQFCKLLITWPVEVFMLTTPSSTWWWMTSNQSFYLGSSMSNDTLLVSRNWTTDFS